ncbi:MAG: hypothetical protein LBI99_03125 [Propionibacteriaceae bacterium]|jgi:hypothetical protein|nr:hypothetical protein [Propionibacteriaceae bacterium]
MVETVCILWALALLAWNVAVCCGTIRRAHGGLGDEGPGFARALAYRVALGAASVSALGGPLAYTLWSKALIDVDVFDFLLGALQTCVWLGVFAQVAVVGYFAVRVVGARPTAAAGRP